LSEISNQPAQKKVSFKISEDDEESSGHKRSGKLATIVESTSEDYTTDSNFVEDSSDRENQQIKLIETESN
jgi:hypothetical protein